MFGCCQPVNGRALHGLELADLHDAGDGEILEVSAVAAALCEGGLVAGFAVEPELPRAAECAG